MSATGASAAIEVRGLRKSYGNFEAVRGIDFRAEAGEILCLLGPNGAGKTTTVEILEGYRQRTAGDVQVLGVDPGRSGRDFRQRIGIVLQSCSIDAYLSVREVVTMHRAYYRKPRDVDEVIELVGLTGKQHARVHTLSGGQQRRLDVALGIIGDPELLFLDEPTTGFDPGARRQSWSIVSNLRKLGTTVLLTTHYMDEAEHLADRIVVIAAGQVMAEGTPANLGGRDRAPFEVRFALAPGSPLPPFGARNAAGVFTFETFDPAWDLHNLGGWAMKTSVELENLAVGRPSLEEMYLRLVGPAQEAMA